MESKREINKKVIDNLKKYCISSEKMSFSEKKPNDYVSNVLIDYNSYVTDIIKLIDELPDNISVSEFASMINCNKKNHFNNYMKIFKHILNTNNRSELIEKINKIEKKAEIFFRKEKTEHDEHVEDDEDDEHVEDVEHIEDVEDEHIEHVEEVIKVKSPPKIKKNVIDYIKANKKKTMEDFPELTVKEVNHLLIKKWNTLSEKEKDF